MMANGIGTVHASQKVPIYVVANSKPWMGKVRVTLSPSGIASFFRTGNGIFLVKAKSSDPYTKGTGTADDPIYFLDDDDVEAEKREDNIMSASNNDHSTSKSQEDVEMMSAAEALLQLRDAPVVLSSPEVFNKNPNVRNSVHASVASPSRKPIIPRHNINYRPFKCGQCDKSYTRRSSRKRHAFNNHDPTSNVPCKICKGQPLKPGYMKSHLNTKKHFDACAQLQRQLTRAAAQNA